MSHFDFTIWACVKLPIFDLKNVTQIENSRLIEENALAFKFYLPSICSDVFTASEDSWTCWISLALLRIALTLNLRKGCLGDMRSEFVLEVPPTTGGLGEMLSSLLWSNLAASMAAAAAAAKMWLLSTKAECPSWLEVASSILPSDLMWWPPGNGPDPGNSGGKCLYKDWYIGNMTWTILFSKDPFPRILFSAKKVLLGAFKDREYLFYENYALFEIKTTSP